VPPQQSPRSLQDQLLAAIDELIAAYESAVARDPAGRESAADAGGGTAAEAPPPPADTPPTRADTPPTPADTPPTPAERSPSPADVRSTRADAATAATVSAGPFASIPELREFERRLAAIPGVSDVRVRGFDGADRAIIEVTLGPAGEAPPGPATQ
jgi:hypothetical protein